MAQVFNTRVLQVARKLAATIGADFFLATAHHLAEAIGADCVIIGEFVGGREERCRSVGGWMNYAPAEFEYALAESATANVVLGKSVFCRSDAMQQFPADTLLKSVAADGLIGIPLKDSAGRAIGVLMSLFRHPVADSRFPRRLMEIFSQRAAAELVRKQDDEKLRESEQRYRAFIATNADGLWRIEFDSPIPTDLPEEEQLDRIFKTGYLAECNDALARLVGVPFADRLLGSGLQELTAASDTSVRAATMAAIRAGWRPTTVETNPLDGNGTRRHLLRSQWGIVEDGKLVRVWGSTRDITEVKHAETALDASEQRITDLLEAMHLLVLILNPDGAVVFCNDYFYRLTGWTPADLLGRGWLEKMIPTDECSRVQSQFVLGDLNEGGGPIHFESSLLVSNGSRKQLAWDSTNLLGRTGEPIARALIGKDITDFKALEEQFRQAQKLAAIGRLAGGVAHDFNNLLTVILGYASGLQDKVRPSDITYTGLTEIRKAAEKGAELSRSLLTFSRRQPMNPRAVDVNSLVRDTEPMLAAAIGSAIKLAVDLRPDAGVARLDAGYFHQVLLNLAINARDAMPRGGTLTITTNPVEVTPMQAQATGIPAGDYVQLTVADTGTGMSEEVREHLFEPFFTTKEMGKGTGLGLSTVYGIVKQVGGQILVDTEVGHGTAFRIYLPAVEAEEADSDSPINRTPPHGTETVLLVEDREDVRTVATTVLTDLGYTILAANIARRAIELSREHAGVIHLLIANIGLPDLPVDELVGLVRVRRPNIKVLFISGYGQADVPQSISGSGSAYLQKPFTPLALAVKVRELLDQN